MHHFIQTLKQSLQVRISIALILMFLPLSIIAGAFSYYQTYHEAEELQDDLLRQTAAYINPKTTDYTQIGSENHILIQTFGQEDTVPLSNTLGEGKVQAQGAPQDVLQADMIGRLYKVDIELLYDSKGLPVIRPMRQSA